MAVCQRVVGSEFEVKEDSESAGIQAGKSAIRQRSTLSGREWVGPDVPLAPLYLSNKKPRASRVGLLGPRLV